jgi:transposase
MSCPLGNPLQASRYRERHGVSGAKSDAGDAHMLAGMVRADSHQLRAVAGDSADAEGQKVLARTHKTLIWERTRQVQRLRHQLLDYFPAAQDAFDDLDAPVRSLIAVITVLNEQVKALQGQVEADFGRRPRPLRRGPPAGDTGKTSLNLPQRLDI